MTNTVKNNDKEKYVYSSYGIAFNGKGSWSFNENFARNVIIFGVGNSSSYHKFDRVDIEEVSFKGDAHDVSVNYDAIDKSNILNIHKYLMIKNSI